MGWTRKWLAIALTGLALAFFTILMPRPPQGESVSANVAEAQPILLINGRADLGDRRYNEVAYATTHNAMSSNQAGYIFPNQISNMRQQLEDGIRALMLDVHLKDGRVTLCHGPCELGSQDFVDGLIEIRGFLDERPKEVVTFILETDQVTPEELAFAFADSGILQYAFVQAPGAAWPTLREMTESGQRLVVFTDGATGGIPWLHNVWDHAWDTNWNIKSAEQFNCNCNRGDPANSLMILNHFISNPLPLPQNAEVANAAPFLEDRAVQCWRAAGRIPNFVTVDYYEIGDVFEVVGRLNGLYGTFQ